MLNKVIALLRLEHLVIIIIVLSSLIILFAPSDRGPFLQAQSDSIRTTSKYVNGHTYILFSTTNGLAAAHDEACFARSHSNGK